MDEKKMTEAQKREACTLVLCLYCFLTFVDMVKVPPRLAKSMLRYFDPDLPIVDRPTPLTAQVSCSFRFAPLYRDDVTADANEDYDLYWNDGQEGPDRFPFVLREKEEWDALQKKVRSCQTDLAYEIVDAITKKLANDACMKSVFRLLLFSMGNISKEEFDNSVPPESQELIAELSADLEQLEQ